MAAVPSDNGVAADRPVMALKLVPVTAPLKVPVVAVRAPMPRAPMPVSPALLMGVNPRAVVTSAEATTWVVSFQTAVPVAVVQTNSLPLEMFTQREPTTQPAAALSEAAGSTTAERLTFRFSTLPRPTSPLTRARSVFTWAGVFSVRAPVPLPIR